MWFSKDICIQVIMAVMLSYQWSEYQCSPVPSHIDICREPDDIEKRLSDIEAADHLSVILPTPIRAKLDHAQRLLRVATGNNDETVPALSEQLLLGNKTCPNEFPSDLDLPIEDRSTCPYYYVISHDWNRYPMAIAEARCRCSECIDDRSGLYLCEPVYFSRTILRKTECVDGVYQYTAETHSIQNGCTCAKRRFAMSASKDQQSSSDTSSSSPAAPTTAALPSQFTFA